MSSQSRKLPAPIPEYLLSNPEGQAKNCPITENIGQQDHPRPLDREQGGRPIQLENPQTCRPGRGGDLIT